MGSKPDTGLLGLGRGLLRLYEQALRLRQFDTAEHLLRALEGLATREEDCCALRDCGYLQIGSGKAGCASEGPKTRSAVSGDMKN
jgi:hypothetical protein